MNYYIDFDHTLYNTPLLTKKMLNTISNFICEEYDLEKDTVMNECKEMFNRKNIYNIFKLSEYFGNKYKFEAKPLKNELKQLLLNCDKFIFEDSIPFLKKLKEKSHNLYLLSYYEDNLDFQTLKITGSKLVNFFDAVIITSSLKYNLSINYEEGIFIDDKPSDLIGLYNTNAKEVIRIRRQNDTYSNEIIENKNIKEYSTLLDIPIN